MSFVPLKEVPTHQLRRAVIANAVGSSTYTIGAGVAIQPGATGHNDFVTEATSSNPVLGVVLAIEYQNKITELSSVAGINAATTNAAPGNDNETAGAWKVVYIPSNIPIDYLADVSAVTGTTTNSQGFGYLNLIAATTGTTGGATLDETSIALFTGTQGQFFSNGGYAPTVSVPGGNPDVPLTAVNATKKVTGHWSKTL